VLAFEPDRVTCVTMAVRAAEQLRLPAAAEAMEELRDLEDTFARDLLLKTLESGVAFHNSDLSFHERQLVERHFKDGHVKVIFATTTLAVGVNLPAQNVLVPARKWRYYRSVEDWNKANLTRSEYENMSGRAGRLPGPGRPRPEFGRSIMVTSSDFQVDTWHHCYVDKELDEIVPSLKETPLEKHVLNLVASQLVRTREQMADLLLSSFTGYVYWKPLMSREAFAACLATAIQVCIDGGLVQEHHGRLDATDLGRVCATKGLEINTAITLATWARTAKDAAITELELVTVLSFTDDAEAISARPPGSERWRSKESYTTEMLQRAQEAGDRPVFRRFRQDPAGVQWKEAFAFKKTMLLQDWIGEEPIRELEARYQLWGGAIARIALDYSWLADGLAATCGAVGWSEERRSAIERLAARLAVGVMEDAVGIASLRVPGLGRASVRRLAKSGLRTVEAISAKTKEELREILKNGRIAGALWAKLHDESAAPARPLRIEPPAPSAIVDEAKQSAPPPRPAEPEASKSAPVLRAAESEVSYGDVVLRIDSAQHRLFYRGLEVPTTPVAGSKTAARRGEKAEKSTRKRPEHMQLQLFRALVILASRAGNVVPMVELAERLFAMGSLRRLKAAPEQRNLRHRIVAALKKALGKHGIDKAELDALIVNVPGVGLRLAVPGRVEVVGLTPDATPITATGT
ncbi:MAG: hypothetical protein HY901_23875, partial [Deltaproteobacteria bacterium]|nr:hypothetical protein [Deltaproteobacteria bacterium]